MSGSRSKVRVKVTGQGQRSRSNLWCTAVGIRESNYQSKYFVRASNNRVDAVDQLLIFLRGDGNGINYSHVKPEYFPVF